jgi:alkanesulfonate monooxygenase SsuD/methylene tetrahydromethanopterin reductase-like flavin-dependent oxidoreductase (luciferase family)
MGAKTRNFYHNLTTRYGFGEVANRIQEYYLAGRKNEAVDAVPDELVRNISLVGSRGFVAERVAAFADAGVTTLLVTPLTKDPQESVRYVEQLREMLPG